MAVLTTHKLGRLKTTPSNRRSGSHNPCHITLDGIKLTVGTIMLATVLLHTMYGLSNIWPTHIFYHFPTPKPVSRGALWRQPPANVIRNSVRPAIVSQEAIDKILRDPVVNPHNYEFVSLPRVECRGNMAILVASAPNNQKLRAAIRKSWGRLANAFQQVSKLGDDKNVNTEVPKNSSLVAHLASPRFNSSRSGGIKGNNNSSNNSNSTNGNIRNSSSAHNNSSSSTSGPITNGAKINSNSKYNIHQDSSNIHSSSFTLVFFLGRVAGETPVPQALRDRLFTEARHHGDMVISSYIDTYNNLSLKSVDMLLWVDRFCPRQGIFVVKCDDDTYINAPLLLDVLREKNSMEHKNTGRHFVVGHPLFHARPHRSPRSKYYVSYSEYNLKFYPPSVSGTAYGMRVDTARLLYQVSLRTPLFRLEDIYIVGMCGQRVGLDVMGDRRFSIALHLVLCQQGHYVSGHRYKPIHMEIVHQAITDRTKCPITYYTPRKTRP